MVATIDFHTHIFPDSLASRAIAKLVENAPELLNQSDGTARSLQESMQKHAIDRSVILPIATKKEQVPTIIEQQSKLDRRFFIPFGTIHPDTDDIDATIQKHIDNHLAGIKFHPEFQNFYIDNKRYFPLYDAICSAGLIVIFHAGKDPGPFSSDHALPEALLNVRSNFPALKMVAAHMGGWKVWDQIPKKLCGTPMYFDTSAVYKYLDRDLFMHIVAKHGTDKILFGSDSPWFDQGFAVQWIDSLPLLQSDKEKIFRLNAEDLLCFNRL